MKTKKKEVIAAPVTVKQGESQVYTHDDNGFWAADCRSRKAQSVADVINLHKALCAVAKAAEEHLNRALGDVEYMRTEANISKSLAALAALKKGGG